MVLEASRQVQEQLLKGCQSLRREKKKKEKIPTPFRYHLVNSGCGWNEGWVTPEHLPGNL